MQVVDVDDGDGLDEAAQDPEAAAHRLDHGRVQHARGDPGGHLLLVLLAPLPQRRGPGFLIRVIGLDLLLQPFPYLLNTPLKTLAMFSSQQSLLGWGGWNPPNSTAASGDTCVMLCPALGSGSPRMAASEGCTSVHLRLAMSKMYWAEIQKHDKNAMRNS